MDDVIMISRNLLEVYGAIVLGCGVVLGIIAGRVISRTLGAPPPTPVERLRAVEAELELINAKLERLGEHRASDRELRRPSQGRAA